MKRSFVAALVFAFLFGACHSSESAKDLHTPTDSSYAIIGKITGQDTGTIFIYHSRTRVHDSARLDHGYFTFKGKSDTVEFCNLYIYKQGDPNNLKGFFLENGKLSMLIKKDSLQDALITGTPTQNEYHLFETVTEKSYNDRMAATAKLYYSARDRKDKKSMDSLDKIFDDLDKEQKKIITDYTRTHPASTVSAYEINENFRYNPDAGQVENLYGMLNDSIQSGFYGRAVHELLKKARVTAIGQTAPDFSAPDALGKSFSVSSFKGRIVLVDFWASWCGPCRRESPALVKAYRQFHAKGFDILGVSLDESKEEWEKAVKDDKLDWTQISDLKGSETDAVSLYGIQGIPMNFLLDKDGKIIGKDLRGENLMKKLQEVLP